MDIINIKEFGEKFTDIYSYKENQIGKKGCKYCRWHNQRMTEENIKQLREILDDWVREHTYSEGEKNCSEAGIKDEKPEKFYGICRKANKIALKAGMDESLLPCVTSNNGHCTLYTASIIKFIRAIFCKGNKNADN